MKYIYPPLAGLMLALMSFTPFCLLGLLPLADLLSTHFHFTYQVTYALNPIGYTLMGLALFPWVCLLVALPFAKWDKTPTGDQWGVGSVIRGDLPSWAKFLSTPDERLPGGMYEATVASVYAKYGRWVTSLYWLGVRNCLMGLAVSLGQRTTDYIPEEPFGFWSRTDTLGTIWRYSKHLFTIKLGNKTTRIVFVCGYQVYRTLNGEFQAAPVFSLKQKGPAN